MSREEQFTRAILDARLPVPEGLLDGVARPAGRRLSVYRNNVAVSLTGALHQGFPVIAKLLGQQNMDGLAAMYLRAHPPSSPLMMHYGANFPEFLENLEQLSHLGYLGDVARLELALRRSYHAGDAAPLDPARLGAMAPQD
ncbi:MAG: putative DNA-binding domain-containing protein, partial [Tritonibacter mobilis]|nr:putative DNA-binding domain-containing protein [Tritonibacter mobilis]